MRKKLDKFIDKYKDRVEAGDKLASIISKDKYDVVIAIAKGGIPVARQLAKHLNIALKVSVVRKIPLPGNPEAGMGAVDETGSTVLNEKMLRYMSMPDYLIEQQIVNVKEEIKRRAKVFKKWLKPKNLEGKKVILTDDGLASGYTMLAEIKSAKKSNAKKITIAVPVAHNKAKQLVAKEVDEFVSLIVETKPSFAVADYYEHWSDLTDEEAMESLKDG